jgi:uncharacterized Rossmann fold enzyme
VSIIIAAVVAVIIAGPIAVGIIQRNRTGSALPAPDEECEVCAGCATHVIVSDADDATERAIRAEGGFTAMAAYYCGDHAPERARPRA